MILLLPLGEPPPFSPTTDETSIWAKSVFRNIFECNDSMRLPTIKLAFDENVQPIIKTFTFPTSYIHVNKNNIMIFLSQTTLPVNYNKSYGYVSTYNIYYSKLSICVVKKKV